MTVAGRCHSNQITESLHREGFFLLCYGAEYVSQSWHYQAYSDQAALVSVRGLKNFLGNDGTLLPPLDIHFNAFGFSENRVLSIFLSIIS